MQSRNPRGRPKGSLNKINRSLKEMILGALKAKNGQRYLEKIAENDPKTFCMLLARVLPLTIAGDPNNPITYEVRLAFGTGGHELPASVPGPALDDKTLVHMRCS
jgi:hypothetical protein